MGMAVLANRKYAQKIVITDHAHKRLKESRQKGVLLCDVYKAARAIPGLVKHPTKFRNFIAKSGRKFSLTFVDEGTVRIITTVIGTER